MCVSARLEPLTFISITYHTLPSVLGTAEQKPGHIILFENHIKPHALVSVTQSAIASRNKAALKQEGKKSILDEMWKSFGWYNMQGPSPVKREQRELLDDVYISVCVWFLFEALPHGKNSWCFLHHQHHAVHVPAVRHASVAGLSLNMRQ